MEDEGERMNRKRGHSRRHTAHCGRKLKPLVISFCVLCCVLCLPVFIHPSASSRLTLSSENFRADYPASVARREVESTLRTLEAARADVGQQLAAVSLKFAAAPKIELFIHDTTGSFVAATGQPAWVGGAARGRRIELQPLAVLARRRSLATTLRHEYAHVVVESLGGDDTPRWLAEGLAAHVAGEGAQLTRATPKTTMTLDELERRLASPSSAQEMRALYAAAYREVGALVREGGEASVWRRIARRR